METKNMTARMGAGWRRATILLAVGAAAFGVASGVYAAIPDTSGVIHGCYSRTSGALRAIDTAKSQKCTTSEVALNWNQTGPKGATGPQGAEGPAGAMGPQGAQGPKGDQGLKGDQGPKGDQGRQGDQGPVGSPGPMGVSGYQEVEDTESQQIPPGTGADFTVACPAGKVLLGGGGGRDNTAAAEAYSGPDPTAPSTTWRLTLGAPTNSYVNVNVDIWAICGSVPSS
jgi:hypothetical protein